MPEILSMLPKFHEQPVAVRSLSIDNLSDENVNLAIREFFDRWRPTHVLSAPTFIVEGGKRFLWLQAVCRALWLQQNEEQGIAAARQNIAMNMEIQGFKDNKIVLVTGAQMPAPQQRPAADQKKGIRGAFER